MPRGRKSKKMPLQEKPALQINKQKLQQFGNVVPPLNVNMGQVKLNTAGKGQMVSRPK